MIVAPPSTATSPDPAAPLVSVTASSVIVEAGDGFVPLSPSAAGSSSAITEEGAAEASSFSAAQALSLRLIISIAATTKPDSFLIQSFISALPSRAQVRIISSTVSGNHHNLSIYPNIILRITQVCNYTL
jgi:hypothetical protein